MDSLHNAIEPAAGSLGKLPSAADAAVGALQSFASRISGIKIDAPSTTSSSSFGRKVDDDIHSRMRRAYVSAVSQNQPLNLA